MVAMAASLPLILTSMDGPREFLPEPHAMWAKPGDETSLAQQLKSVRTRARRRCEYDLASLSRERATNLVEDFCGKILRAKATGASLPTNS